MHRVVRRTTLVFARVFPARLNVCLTTFGKMNQKTASDCECNTVLEGKANALLPSGVFYNPVQQFNRDVTIAVVRHFQLVHQYEWLERTKRHIRGSSNYFSKFKQTESHRYLKFIKVWESWRPFRQRAYGRCGSLWKFRTFRRLLQMTWIQRLRCSSKKTLSGIK